MAHLLAYYSMCALSDACCADSDATIVVRVKSWIVSALHFVPAGSHAPSIVDALPPKSARLHKVFVVFDNTKHVCPHLLYDCDSVLISHGFVVQVLRYIAHELTSESQVDITLHKATMSSMARVLYIDSTVHHVPLIMELFLFYAFMIFEATLDVEQYVVALPRAHGLLHHMFLLLEAGIMVRLL